MVGVSIHIGKASVPSPTQGGEVEAGEPLRCSRVADDEVLLAGKLVILGPELVPGGSVEVGP